MLKQLSINSSKGILKTYKANILKKIELKKKGDEMYKEYIMNAIKEGEEYLANGGNIYFRRIWRRNGERIWQNIN